MKHKTLTVVSMILLGLLRATDSAMANPALTYTDLGQICGRDGTVIAANCATPADVSAVKPLCDGTATPTQAASIAALPCVLQSRAAGAPTTLSLPWVSIVTDFFVARAKAELVLFLKNRIVDSVCASDSPSEMLLPETCQLLSGSSANFSGLPTALRRDLADAPAHLASVGLTFVDIGKVPADAKPAICVLDLVGRAYPTLRDRGPLHGLETLASLTPHAGCQAEPSVKRVQFAAATLAYVIRDVVPAMSGGIDPIALLASIKLFLADRMGTYGATGAEVAIIAANLTASVGKLDLALTQISKLGELSLRDPKQVVSMLETVADLFAAYLPSSDTSDAVILLRASSAFASAHYTSGLLRLGTVKSLTTWLEKHKQLKKMWSGITTFAGVLGGLAEAKNEDDARTILESAAAPVGSYRDFRQGGWTAFVSGYAGLGGGLEVGGDVGKDALFAPLLPIGIEFGHPLCKSSSFNVLVSVFDIGAVAATRLTKADSESVGNNGDVRRSAERGLRGVLAPGIFLGFGLGDSPFVLGIGGEFLPASRAVFECPEGVPCGETRTEPVFRASVFLALDLPVFPLYRH